MDGEGSQAGNARYARGIAKFRHHHTEFDFQDCYWQPSQTIAARNTSKADLPLVSSNS